MLTILTIFSTVLFISVAICGIWAFIYRTRKLVWIHEFALFRGRMERWMETYEKKTNKQIESLTRRPPKEWTLADFEQLVNEHPDKFHIRFIMLDGTKVEIDRKGFTSHGEPIPKKDPYAD